VSSGTLKNLESARLSIPSQLIKTGEHQYEWITNLSRTEPFWKGWFTDLSRIFLSAKVTKVLMLAGTDRLDKELTIAQMQGKFQLTVLSAVGHTIQEDVSLFPSLILFSSANNSNSLHRIPKRLQML
jgi:protein phosphatase methylesterase 1